MAYKALYRPRWFQIYNPQAWLSPCQEGDQLVPSTPKRYSYSHSRPFYQPKTFTVQKKQSILQPKRRFPLRHCQIYISRQQPLLITALRRALCSVQLSGAAAAAGSMATGGVPTEAEFRRDSDSEEAESEEWAVTEGRREEKEGGGRKGRREKKKMKGRRRGRGEGERERGREGEGGNEVGR
jgi:hypothetical protein